jgi:hypothetical protein
VEHTDSIFRGEESFRHGNSKKQTASRTTFFASLVFDSEDGGNMIFLFVR